MECQLYNKQRQPQKSAGERIFFLRNNQNSIQELIIPHKKIIEKYLAVPFSELLVAAADIKITSFIRTDDDDDVLLLKKYRAKLLSGREDVVVVKKGRLKKELRPIININSLLCISRRKKTANIYFLLTLQWFFK